MPFQLSFSLLGKSKLKSQQQQQQPPRPQTMASGDNPAPAVTADTTFRLTFLGKQAINRPTNNTGFGSVQKPLRDIYLAAGLETGKEPKADRTSERTFVFDSNEMQIRFWDATARRFQQESWPLDCVNYLDLVLFQTVKGKKRHFGYFRRHTDPTDVVPDAVLIPLHKRDAKNFSKSRHRPILCFLVRRPYGIQFLECHAYLADDEATGRAFIDRFDKCSADKLRNEQQGGRRPLFNYAPWQPAQDRAASSDTADGNVGGVSKWASQPALASVQVAPAAAAPAAAADHSPRRGQSFEQQQKKQQQQQQPQPDDRRYRSSGNLGVSLVPSSDGSFVVMDSSLVSTTTSQSSSSSSARSASTGQGQLQQPPSSAMQRSASGTIFEKYKELQAFNIPESEYMGFQEMQQQLGQRRQQQQQQQQQQLQKQQQLQQQQKVPTGLGGSSKFPSDSNIARSRQQQQQQPPPPPSTSSQQSRDQQHHVIQRRTRAPTLQAVEQHRPSTILEESQFRNSQLPAASSAVPSEQQQQPPESRSVASLVNRFERIKQHPAPLPSQLPAPSDPSSQRHLQQLQQLQQQIADDRANKPVARVFPTSREIAQPPPQQLQHKVNRSASSRVQPGGQPVQTQYQLQQQQQSDQQRDFASALGYLP